VTHLIIHISTVIKLLTTNAQSNRTVQETGHCEVTVKSETLRKQVKHKTTSNLSHKNR